MASVCLSTFRCFKSVNISSLLRSNSKASPHVCNRVYVRALSDLVTPDHVVEPPIPPYIERQNEECDVKRARLLYQSRKRGMTENGLLLSTFAAKYLANFTEAELKVYDKLINQPSNDWEIYYWITDAKPTPTEFESDVLTLLKKHAKNANKDVRSTQPDLY